ncbi:hypothetical protein ZWY2020_050799 [Hordeum vulgare]|nr:hypothetical protein ZWY2020_050799 [Hordeum vulgare]
MGRSHLRKELGSPASSPIARLRRNRLPPSRRARATHGDLCSGAGRGRGRSGAWGSGPRDWRLLRAPRASRRLLHPGRHHDFALLRRLALPYVTILRCEHHVLPTRDCLFLDPLHDGRTMLKIWNVNRFSGVLGAFNCQGGGWSPEAWRNKCCSQCSVPVTARARPADIEWKQGTTHPVAVDGAAQFAVYFVEAKKLELMLPEETVEISMMPPCQVCVVASPNHASHSHRT